MKTAVLKALAASFGGALLSCLLLANAHGAATALGSEPFTSSTKINALPNVMFVLDDSGSMSGDYLPDWAGPYTTTFGGVTSVNTPAHRFYNGSYNGVAYNPATRYLPPVMYTSSGAIDTSTYPSQTGQSVATGGNASATATAPNWTAVKVDGYGIQSTAKASLEGHAFSYTTVAGEYCDSAQLRSCVASTTNSAYTFPARLRWCHDSTLSVDTTANAGTTCQASNIADTPTNATNGVTTYTYPRMPQPHFSTITIGADGTVTSLTVNGVQLLSAASVTGGTSTDLATAIAASINACTFARTGTVCQTVGYSAVSVSNVVTLTAPAPPTQASGLPVSPVVAGATTTVTAFGNGFVPGSVLLTVITPTVTSYVYPGTSAKGSNRTDCADAVSCTYAEEMTNYANWYAYYRTRMQMMKTASSIAFSAVDDKFRVGYYSINNGAGSQFLNVGAFSGAQKYSWYTDFLSATPYGATPLRTGLATIGRMYAGQLSALNGVTVVEPMQYSCQQNFTILSTDGYWNDSTNPKRINGIDDIGQQDGSLDRPYYDGGTQTKTISYILQSFQQKTKYEFIVESDTRQLETSTSQLSKELTTITREPWEITTSHLQTHTRTLTSNAYNLESRSYPLIATTNVLRENTFKPQSTTLPLIRSTFSLKETTTNLTKKITNVDTTTYNLQVGTQDITSTTSPLQIKTRGTTKTTANLQKKTSGTTSITTPVQIRTQSVLATATPVLMNTQAVTYTTTPVLINTQAVTYTTTPVQIKTQAVTYTTSALQKGTQGVLVAISPLQSTTYNLQSVNFQLQKRSLVSTNGGDTYTDTGWVDLTSGSCTPLTGGAHDPEKNVTCRYNATTTSGGLASCTSHDQTASPPYTALTANTCSYETTPVVAAAATCAVVAKATVGPTYPAAVSCAYGAAAAAVTTPSCVANDQTGAASMSGSKKVCSYDSTVLWGATTVLTCSPSDPAYASAKISCRYGPAGSAVAGACAANDQTASLATNGAAISGNKVECGVDTTATFADATGSPATCVPRAEVYATNISRISCQLGTPLVAQAGACAKNDQGTTLTAIGTTYKNRVLCGFDGNTTYAAPSGGTCTPTAAATTASYAAGTAQVLCKLAASASAAVSGACTKNLASTTAGAALTTAGTAYKDKVVCGFDGNTTYAAPSGGTCTPSVAATDASNVLGTAQVLCKLSGTASAAVAGACAANDQGTSLTSTSTVYKDKVVCSLDTAPVFANATNSPRSCTPVTANYATGVSEVSCKLAASPLAAVAGTCTANLAGTGDGTALTTAGTYNDKVLCALASASFADVGGTTPTCTPKAADYTLGTAEVACQYGTAGSAVAGACVANDQTSALTTIGTLISGNQVTCGLLAASFGNASGTPRTCTPTAADYPSGTAEITCRYGTAGSAVTGACVANDQTASLTTIGAALSGNLVVCGVGTTTWVDALPTSAPVCTPRAVNFATNVKALFCRYNPTAASVVTNAGPCTVFNQPTTAAMAGNQIACTYHASAASTDSNAISCTQNVGTVSTTSGATLSAKTECAYSGTSVSSPLTSCTVVDQTAGVTTNGVTSSGPAKACEYLSAVLYPALPADTPLPNCSHVGSSSPTGKKYDQYVTCAVGTSGSIATGLDSCTAKDAGLGPDYANPTVSCDYPTAATSVSTDATRTACTWVAPAGDKSVPYKTCSYDGDVAQTVTSCTNLAKSTGGTGTYAGPASSCAYGAENVAARNLSATSCTPHRQTASPYSGGAAVDCSYNATPTPSAVTTCSVHDDSASAGLWSGPKIGCVEGTVGDFGPWTNVTSGSCVVAGQSGPTDYVQWRECRYSDPALETTHSNVCNPVAPSGGSPYSVLTPVYCRSGSFTTNTTVVTSVVDSCSTLPTQTGDTSPPTGTEQINTTTTCNYAASPTVAGATSCTPAPRQTSSPYATEVLCTSTAGSWVRVAGACSPVGTQPPTSTPGATVVSEFVGGINTACRTTDITGTPLAFAKAAECTAGIDAALLQTQCAMPIDTTPTPVNPAPAPANPTPCVATIGLPTGPDYIKTICTPVSTATTVMGCAALGPTAPLWQTITCVDIPGSGTTDTLADVAAYYYYTDLRTTALGNCTGSPVSPALTGEDLCAKNDVPVTTKDPLSSQHMTTFTLGLGASGYMKFSSTYPTDASGDYTTVHGVAPYAPVNGIAASPSTGVCSWQATGNCNWPYPAGDEQTTIDDLWHAGVNGHGAYFSATDPSSLSTSLAAALAGVAAAGGSAAAAAISTPNLVPADNYVFSSTYTTSDWTGELVRKQLDPLTAAPSTSADWSVQAKLDANSSRTIYTFDSTVAGTKLKPFTSANFAGNANFLMPHISTSPGGLTQFLCAYAETCLSAGDQDSSHASGANLVNYLRGERGNEGALKDNTKYYRQRQHVLGDMVNAQVVYVTSPLYNFGDAGYSLFATAQKSRQAMVYAGANDGMLHAFAAKGSAATEALVQASATATRASALNPTDTDLKTAADAAAVAAAVAEAADPLIGQELWAYIPTMVIPNLYRLADKKYKDLHRYFVDGTPVVGDICVNCDVTGVTAATAVWKTILVGGLGGGGRGYYALDITVPASPKALWEFTDSDLGYSYGNPQIVKNSAGKWVVLLTSGYNNIPNDDGAGGDGAGRLFVLDAASGVALTGVSPILTGVGSSTAPSGLSKITAQVVNPSTDLTVEAVYGGDLLGNLWRFDINDTVGATGYDAQLLAVFKDGAGNRQPITAQPEVADIPNVDAKIVFIGTGRFLAASDASDTSQQSFYAVKDVRATGTTPATAIFDNPGGSPRRAGTSTEGFVRQVQCYSDGAGSACQSTGSVIISSNNTVALASDNGWFFDLINSSERANTDPTLVLGLLAFNTNAPTLAACDVGGTSYQYALNYLTGGPVQVAGNFDAAANTGIVGKFLASALASSVTLVVDGSSNIHAVTELSSGEINVNLMVKPPSASITRRTSWRELIRE